MTDTAATRPYGVLGRVLGHSYTPTIYKELAGLEYVRFEREPEDLAAFMTGDEWEGTNVTIPYKRAVMEYLDELNKRTFLWVELGLQSSNDKTAQLINRGHDFRTFMKAVEQLRERNIRVCVHIINGLPGETYDDMIKTVKDISVLDINAVKIHMLYILKDTPLFKLYEKEKFSVMKREDYIQTVADQIELLPEEVIVERVTGDGKADDLKAPLWSLNKISILNDIDKELVRRNTWQGIKRNIEV